MKVQVTTLRQATHSRELLLEGRIVARESVLIHPLLEGLRVERVLVEAGQRVTAGQALVQLDQRSLRHERQQAAQGHIRAQAQLAGAQAQLAQLEARSQQAQEEAKRYALVAGSGAVSEIETNARRLQFVQVQAERVAAAHAAQAAQAELATTHAALQLAQEREHDGVLRARSSGLISERHVEVGQISSFAGGPWFTLDSSEEREFEALLDSSQLHGLSLGTSVQLKLHTAHGQLLRKGRVRVLDQTLAEGSRRGRLRISLEDSAVLQLGAAASAHLQLSAEKGLAVPASAVQFDPQPWVFVVDRKGQLEKRRISLSNDGQLASQGLQTGETVVRSAGALLSAGQSIEAVHVHAQASQFGAQP